jgi:hypothetical protein
MIGFTLEVLAVAPAGQNCGWLKVSVIAVNAASSGLTAIPGSVDA